MKFPSRTKGFTLLEIIVVIVLFSLIATLAMQGISYVLAQRSRMALFQQELIKTTLRHQWFQESTSQLLVPPDDKRYQLIGSAESFSGITASPLLFPERAGEQITWVIARSDAGISLTYVQSNNPDDSALSTEKKLILFEDLRGEAYFRYMDELGQFHEGWPPVDGRYSALPDGIYLYVESADEVELSWFVKLRNAKTSRLTEQFVE